MAGINKVILVGHLGVDPEVRTIESGAKVARLRLATTETYKDKNGEKKEATEWHTITCWRNLADIAEKYLTKGKLIYVEGKLRTRTWEDNGVKRYVTEVLADNFTMLGAKSDGSIAPVSNFNADTSSVQPQNTMENENKFPNSINEEDDLPF